LFVDEDTGADEDDWPDPEEENVGFSGITRYR